MIGRGLPRNEAPLLELHHWTALSPAANALSSADPVKGCRLGSFGDRSMNMTESSPDTSVSMDVAPRTQTWTPTSTPRVGSPAGLPWPEARRRLALIHWPGVLADMWFTRVAGRAPGGVRFHFAGGNGMSRE